jgi:hypothetical protein
MVNTYMDFKSYVFVPVHYLRISCANILVFIPNNWKNIQSGSIKKIYFSFKIRAVIDYPNIDIMMIIYPLNKYSLRVYYMLARDFKKRHWQHGWQHGTVMWLVERWQHVNFLGNIEMFGAGYI